MAAFSFHAPSGRTLASFGPDAKAGDEHTISMGSRAYSQPSGTFGFPSTQWTHYVLPEPVAADWGGHPLFDLRDLGTCPLDGSPQTDEVRIAAERREAARVEGWGKNRAWGASR